MLWQEYVSWLGSLSGSHGSVAFHKVAVIKLSGAKKQPHRR